MTDKTMWRQKGGGEYQVSQREKRNLPHNVIRQSGRWMMKEVCMKPTMHPMEKRERVKTRARGYAEKWRAEKGGDNRAQSPLASAESLRPLILFNYFSSIYLQQLTDNINSSLAERQRYFSLSLSLCELTTRARSRSDDGVGQRACVGEGEGRKADRQAGRRYCPAFVSASRLSQPAFCSRSRSRRNPPTGIRR